MAWLAIERHILIFHDRWVSNRRGRFLFHYLPLIILVTYILVFYSIAIFTYLMKIPMISQCQYAVAHHVINHIVLLVCGNLF
jgi:hypothetical protein